MARGLFITLEGSEGVGKSTNLTFIKEYLLNKGIDLLVTREPGGTPLAEDIRQLLLQKREEAIDEKAELLLVFAARAQHLNTVVIPALEKGQWVICDRFTDSTYAYQGGGRGLDTDLIQLLETVVQQQLQPDATIYLDIDVKQGLARATQRAELDRFESEDIAFFERVRAMFLSRVEQDKKRYHIVDASQPLEKVQQDISHILHQL